METLTPRQTPTATGPARLARKRFDPTRLFAQRDRLPWFWFFVAVAVTVLAALDRYHLIGQFKQRERVVIIDPSQTYYLSPFSNFRRQRICTRNRLNWPRSRSSTATPRISTIP